MVTAADLAAAARRPDPGRRDRQERRHRQQLRQSPPLGGRRKRGAKAQAIGVSRGGRTTKIHLATDLLGRPIALHLTPGNVADIRAAPAVLGRRRPLHPADRRPRLRRRQPAPRSCGHRPTARHPGTDQSKASRPPRRAGLSRALEDRGHGVQAQGLPPRRHPRSQPSGRRSRTRGTSSPPTSSRPSPSPQSQHSGCD